MKHIFRGILVILFVTTSVQGLAQTNTEEIIKSYQVELKLDNSQESQFKKVIEKYNIELNENNLTTNAFNALVKKETLEIYKILSPEQFGIYKKIKKSIEPSKKYRFENN